MPTTITGTNGVNQVAPNSVDFADLKNALFNGLLSANGYVKIPVRDQGVERELIVQWGKTTSISSNASQAVTFPVPFPTACRIVQVTANSDSGASAIGSSALSATVSGFSLKHVADNSSAASYDWFAIGY